MSYCTCLLNLVLLDKELENSNSFGGKVSTLFPSNWEYLQEVGEGQDYLFHRYTSGLRNEQEAGGFGAILKIAVDNIIDSQASMVAIQK